MYASGKVKYLFAIWTNVSKIWFLLNFSNDFRISAFVSAGCSTWWRELKKMLEAFLRMLEFYRLESKLHFKSEILNQKFYGEELEKN